MFLPFLYLPSLPKTHSLFLTDASMRAIKSNCSGGSCINSILCTHKGNDILKGKKESVFWESREKKKKKKRENKDRERKRQRERNKETERAPLRGGEEKSGQEGQ